MTTVYLCKDLAIRFCDTRGSFAFSVEKSLLIKHGTSELLIQKEVPGLRGELALEGAVVGRTVRTNQNQKAKLVTYIRLSRKDSLSVEERYNLQRLRTWVNSWLKKLVF